MFQPCEVFTADCGHGGNGVDMDIVKVGIADQRQVKEVVWQVPK